ncbi:DUF2931 family protein [Hymenobacter lapidiphilus]|uniref:DUF2931 family protein n=1 Tax=Hymenobacter sp. CCM 8763 TaxID=2303334 RepID=UPI00167CB234|nr:DUF2931 family protein [Hymenobacter sp. CCM 8763]
MGLFLLYSPLAYREWQRQYWAGVVIDESNYPARLIVGSLAATNGEQVKIQDPGNDENSKSSNDGKYMNYNWNFDEWLAASFQLPPRQLQLTWASIPERRFYRGNFALPAGRVDSVFALAETNPAWRGSFSKMASERYHEIYLDSLVYGPTVVVRPGWGGRVRVWLAGRDTLHVVRLGDFQAQSFQPNWDKEPPYVYDGVTQADYWAELTRQEKEIRHIIPPIY